jgi:hypothetical protein
MVAILKRDMPDAEVQSKSECVHCQMRPTPRSPNLDADAFFFEVRAQWLTLLCGLCRHD